MDRSDVITLLDVRHTIDASGTEISEIAGSREVFVQIRSVGVKESYAAMSVGHNPEIKATIAESADYAGEKYAWYRGQVYKVLRTYQTGLAVELTLERTRDLEGMI